MRYWLELLVIVASVAAIVLTKDWAWWPVIVGLTIVLSGWAFRIILMKWPDYPR